MSRSDGDGASVASERFASARGDGSLRGLGGVRSTNTAKQFWTLVGVGFWIVGPIVGYLLWKRWRGPEEEDG